MAIESVSYSDRTQQAQTARARLERQREESSAPDLRASIVASAQTLMGALAPNATETKRLNDLVNSAKAAAVQLVTQPVETVPTAKVKSVDELLDGVSFRRSSSTETSRQAAAESAATVRAPASQPPVSPVTVPPAVDEPDAPVEATAPDVTPPLAPAEPATTTPVVESPPIAPAAEPPVAAAPEPAQTVAETPVAPTTAPEPQQPVTAAPAPSQPAAPAPSQPNAAQPSQPSQSSGFNNFLGGLFGRR